MVGICGLTSAFTAQGRRSTTDQCHSNRAALLWLKPVTLILTRARAFWFQQRPGGSSQAILAADCVSNCCFRAEGPTWVLQHAAPSSPLC